MPKFSLLGWLEVNTSLWGNSAESATAPRLYLLGSATGPHVADCFAAVNMGLL